MSGSKDWKQIIKAKAVPRVTWCRTSVIVTHEMLPCTRWVAAPFFPTRASWVLSYEKKEGMGRGYFFFQIGKTSLGPGTFLIAFFIPLSTRALTDNLSIGIEGKWSSWRARGPAGLCSRSEYSCEVVDRLHCLKPVDWLAHVLVMRLGTWEHQEGKSSQGWWSNLTIWCSGQNMKRRACYECVKVGRSEVRKAIYSGVDDIIVNNPARSRPLPCVMHRKRQD